MRIVLDWDGTVTEVDALNELITQLGDGTIFDYTNRVLGRALSLHEVIELEMRTLRIPIDEAAAWACEHVTVRRGFAEFAREFEPVILSAGFVELIDPVLEREGVQLEVLANRIDARPDGWRPLWRDDAHCGECGEACKRAGIGQGPVVFVGDGYSDRCAALAADRVFARDRLARYLSDQDVAYEPFSDFVALASQLRSGTRP